MSEGIHRRVARMMLDRFMPRTNASPVWVAEEVKSVSKILLREYGDEKAQPKFAVHELRVALECVDPLLKSLAIGDTREMGRLARIINAARDKYPL